MIEEKTRVILHTGERLKWADGKTGTVCRTAKSMIDLVREDNLMVQDYYVVRVDGMDPNKPPYGMAGVYENEIEVIAEAPAEEPKDNVNHPSHYTDGQYECIDYMESRGYVNNGYLFNAVKYISRAGKKDPEKLDEDLDKAVWYLKRMQECTRENKKLPTSVDDYIQDKGLAGTARGMALKLIDHHEYDLAIEMLTNFRNTSRDA